MTPASLAWAELYLILGTLFRRVEVELLIWHTVIEQLYLGAYNIFGY